MLGVQTGCGPQSALAVVVADHLPIDERWFRIFGVDCVYGESGPAEPIDEFEGALLFRTAFIEPALLLQVPEDLTT